MAVALVAMVENQEALMIIHLRARSWTRSITVAAAAEVCLILLNVGGCCEPNILVLGLNSAYFNSIVRISIEIMSFLALFRSIMGLGVNKDRQLC